MNPLAFAGRSEPRRRLRPVALQRSCALPAGTSIPRRRAGIVPADHEALAAQKAAYQRLDSSREMVALCRRALGNIFEEMSGHCSEIVVFEGRVNSTHPSEDFEPLQAETREFLLRQQQQGFIRFVPIEEQALNLQESLWRDVTHVNAEERRKYTEMFARILAEPPQRRESSPPAVRDQGPVAFPVKARPVRCAISVDTWASRWIWSGTG